MREGGSGVIKLNSEIRNLSEEINAKRSELFEQEEVWKWFLNSMNKIFQ